MRKDNATFLFERPFQNARSEHYWSSLFAMFLIHLGRRDSPASIPTFRLDYEPPHWSFSESGRLDPTAITWDGLFVEPAPRELLRYVCAGRLRPTEEQILANYLGESRRVGPELVVFRPDGSPQLVLIEVKTAAGRLQPDTIKRYRDAERMLTEQLGLSAAFMMVCSVGHMRASGIDEREISRSRVEVILWDRVLEMMAQDDEFRRFLPPDVAGYTKAPLECACPRSAGEPGGRAAAGAGDRVIRSVS